jgi:hypothetical protein
MLRSKAPRSAVRWSRRRYILLRMRDDRYRPFDIEELEDKPSLTNEPVAADNVGVLVPGRQRSLHAMVAQNLKDTEALIGRLCLGCGWRTVAGGLFVSFMWSVGGSARCRRRRCDWKS